MRILTEFQIGALISAIVFNIFDLNWITPLIWFIMFMSFNYIINTFEKKKT